MLAVLLLAKVQACVRVYNSACWAEVILSERAASTTSKGVAMRAWHKSHHGHLLNRSHQ